MTTLARRVVIFILFVKCGHRGTDGAKFVAGETFGAPHVRFGNLTRVGEYRRRRFRVLSGGSKYTRGCRATGRGRGSRLDLGRKGLGGTAARVEYEQEGERGG